MSPLSSRLYGSFLLGYWASTRGRPPGGIEDPTFVVKVSVTPTPLLRLHLGSTQTRHLRPRYLLWVDNDLLLKLRLLLSLFVGLNGSEG